MSGEIFPGTTDLQVALLKYRLDIVRDHLILLDPAFNAGGWGPNTQTETYDPTLVLNVIQWSKLENLPIGHNGGQLLRIDGVWDDGHTWYLTLQENALGIHY